MAQHLAAANLADGKIVNELEHDWQPESVPAASAPEQPVTATSSMSEALLTEDEVKSAVKALLEAEGWAVQVAWGRDRGIDIDAQRYEERLIIEAKGAAARHPQQVNYFLGALGELVQRMSDPSARYALALPDNRQYRGSVARLPLFAKTRLHLHIYFVSPVDGGYSVSIEN